MVKTKTTPRKADIINKRKAREPSKWGSADRIASHGPPVLPPRDVSGNPSYKGMNGKYMYCSRVNCMDVEDVGDV